MPETRHGRSTAGANSCRREMTRHGRSTAGANSCTREMTRHGRSTVGTQSFMCLLASNLFSKDSTDSSIFAPKRKSKSGTELTKRLVEQQLPLVFVKCQFDCRPENYLQRFQKRSNKMTLLYSILFPASRSTCFGWNIHPSSGALSTPNAVNSVYSSSWCWVNVSPETCTANCRH
jgi:hypothetical protein